MGSEVAAVWRRLFMVSPLVLCARVGFTCLYPVTFRAG